MNATRRIVLGLALAVGAAVAVGAQQPPASPATEPQVTFKVEINYVEVDAAVFDRQGGFVRDLKRDDFEVIEDGVPQDVTAFTQVNIPIERAEPAPLQATAVIEPDVVSNVRPFEGRVYVIILDDKHTAALRSAQTKKAAEQFISRYMADNDLAAVITTSGQGGGTQEFTSNKRLLLRAVNKFIGQKLRSETEERLDEYQRQRAVPCQGNHRVADPLGHAARLRRARGARDARPHLRLGRQHSRPPQGDRVLQRRHRLQHLRLQQAGGDDGPGEDAGGIRLGHPVERQHLLDRPARADHPRRRDHRGLWRLSRKPAAQPEPAVVQRVAPPVAGQPAQPIGGNRWLCGGEPQRLQRRLLAGGQGQQLVLRARLLPEERPARRPVPQDRGQGQARRAPRCVRAVATPRRAARRRRRRRCRPATRPRPRCARRSTARCRCRRSR